MVRGLILLLLVDWGLDDGEGTLKREVQMSYLERDSQ